MQQKLEKYQIPFINACIIAFAERMHRPVAPIFNYLNRFKGIQYLVNFYDVIHLGSIDDAVDELVIMCKKNGRQLA